MYDIIKNNIEESVQLVQAVNNDPELIKNIELACSIIIKQFDKNKKLLICGNGGSAADAQHIASEFTGKYYLDRAPMNAEALHTDTSYLTAVSNDYGFEHIYSRMVEAKANKGDVLIAMSTSGNSKNIIKAIKKANQMGLHIIGLGSELKGEMATLCQTFICVPSKNTARIQEIHLFIGHTICQIVEAHFHNNKK